MNESREVKPPFGAAGEPLLEGRLLTKTYRLGHSRRSGSGKAGTLCAVQGFDIALYEGRTLALVGESGCGKSTAARMLAQLVRPTSGKILLHGRPVTVRTGRQRRRYVSEVQLLLQDPFASLNPVHSIRYQLTRVLRLHGYAGSRGEIEQNLHALLEKVQLTPASQYLDKYPHELSGGQLQRIAIARALAARPRVLLLDEPVSMLDVSIRLGVLNLLRKLKDEEQLAVLYITHDIASARYFADDVLVMYRGHIIEGGSSEDVTQRPAHPYTQLLIESAPDPARRGSANQAGRPAHVHGPVDPAGCPFDQVPICHRHLWWRHAGPVPRINGPLVSLLADQRRRTRAGESRFQPHHRSTLMTETAPPIPVKPSRPKPPVEPDYPQLEAGYLPYRPGQDLGERRLRCVQSDTTDGTLQRLIEGFRRYHRHVEINDWVCGSGAGGAALTDDWADFAFVAREMLPREQRLFTDAFGYEPLRVAVAGGSHRTLAFTDALGVVVHASNPLRSLTLAQLDALYSTTRRRGHPPVTRWGDLGLTGEWADRRINLWGVRSQNGFEQFFKERVLRGGAYRDDLHLADLVFPIADNVAADVAALGYTGLAYLADGVRLVDLEPEDGGPALPPTIANVAAQRYPLARSIYVFAHRHPVTGVDPAVGEFARFILSEEGQQAVRAEGTFLPLPARLARRELSRLAV